MSSTEIEELKTLVQSLRKEVTKISDESAIRKLHHAYGYYLDKCLYSETVSLFADDASTSVEFLGGRYLRKEGVHRLYIGRFASRFVQGRNGPVHGFLLDHCQMQDIVDVDADGIHAKGRFRALMSAGTHKSIKDTHPRGLVQWWEGGVYENEYIKEDGVWKIWKLRYFPFWHAEFEMGWSAMEEGEFVGLMSEVRGPGNELGPDELVEGGCMLWPFHYKHPVTGEDVKENDLRAPGWGEDVESSKPALKLN